MQLCPRTHDNNFIALPESVVCMVADPVGLYPDQTREKNADPGSRKKPDPYPTLENNPDRFLPNLT